ncbi:hypothetical protein [Gryllotalpicola ginsengisoli]|uniref:hypothetical protein n=1 Tax=Gryllotalpicola ginsengisoli TaxID=444608 RepID=UPI0003B47F5E|nr:hypothetical protein [Gryllotalpicola ginsengisoli]
MSGNGYPKFKVDGPKITQLQSDLANLITQFNSADDSSAYVADAVGHDHLADKVRDFSKKWHDKRKDMVTGIENIKKLVDAVIDGVDKLDRELKHAVKQTKDATGKSKSQSEN